jgi:hypothetical protein
MCSLLALLCALAFPLPGQTSAQTAIASRQNDDGELRAILKQLIAELASLRIELRQQRLERQQLIISNLENDIRQVQVEKMKLEEREQAQGSEIAELDEHLQQPDLEPAERASLEAAKAKVLIAVPEKLRAEKAIILARERQLQDRLLREQQLRQVLLSETKTAGR